MDSAMSFVGQWRADCSQLAVTGFLRQKNSSRAGRALRRGIFFRPISWMAHRIGGRKKPPR